MSRRTESGLAPFGSHWTTSALWAASLGVGSLGIASLAEAAPTAWPAVGHVTLTSLDEGEPQAARPTLRFNFAGATFRDVVNFFSRSTGLPVVWETDPPDGTLDYLSPESYEFEEALRILNVILQAKGVMLRQDDDMLYLQKLTEMQRESIPTFIGELDESLSDEQIVTVVRPLNIAVSSTLAERLKEMIASYGSVTSLNQQNALVITETVAQIKRLNQIIDELDKEDTQGVIEIIAIRHANAKDIMVPLNALLSQRVEKYVVNAKGKQVKIEEETMPGLNIAVSERTNSLVAKGVRSRIDQLKEAIAILDVPSTAGGTRQARTFILEQLAPSQAVRTLNTIFERIDGKQRPIMLPFDETARLTLVGTVEHLTEAANVLAEIDGGGESNDRDHGTTFVSIPLEVSRADAVIGALRGLLSNRQQQVLKLVAGPDGETILVSGPPRDVSGVERIIPVLDRQSDAANAVRVMRLNAPEPAAVVDRATALYARQRTAADAGTDDPRWALTTEYDAETRLLTLVGGDDALDRFATALRTVEQNLVIERETRRIAVTNGEPSRLAPALQGLARQMLDPRDGSTFVAPTIEAVDALDLLIVTAPSEHFAMLQSLIESMDRPDPAAFQFRAIATHGVADIDELLTRAHDAYDRMTVGYAEGELAKPSIEHDTVGGHLLVNGDADAVEYFERAWNEAKRLLPPAREGRLVALRQADASDVVAPLQELLTATAPVNPGREIAAPAIEVIERTNALYVVAEPAQHAMIERFVRELDTIEPKDLPPLKLLQVRAADAAQLSTMLRKRYESRPADQRREMPVSIDADAATNTLIVTAHETVFDEIKEFVDSVNRADSDSAERETILFPLKRARAQDVAQALEKLYPEPPMPVDRRGRPMPHLREPREVYVSADAATNTLIVEAPSERKDSFEALVEQLDRVELPPRAELRTYRIERGDPALIARTLSELARRGIMAEQPADGSKPVEVLVQAEPKSRTLIVAGDHVTFEQAESILADLEVVPVQRALRVFEVNGADLETFSAQAQRLYTEQTTDIPGAQPVSVEVDRASGTLLVVAENEAMMRFAAILDQLQATVGPPPDVQLIPLEYAEATDVVSYLKDLAETHQALSGRRGPAPMFEAIERTNSLLVAAQRDVHPLIRALVSELDQMEPKAMPPLRIMQLRTADAANLARALTDQYNRRPVDERNEKPVRITADAQTNALMIAAHDELMPEIQAIVQELNSANRLDTEGREIRIFPLKVARAVELAQTIDDMFPEPPVPVDRRGRPMPQLREPREVVVRADPQTNSIIVDAPVQRMAGFETLVEQLDRQRITDETVIRTYDVVHAELDTVAKAIRDLANGGALNPSGQDRRVPILVQSEPVSRTLIVSGPAEIFEKVEQVLGEMDARHAGPATTLRFFALKNARAESMAEMLRQVLTTRLREDVPDAGADVDALLEVTADRKTNTVIISAPDALQRVAEQLIEQLDKASAAVGDPVVRVRPLTFADAGEVSSTLMTALTSMVSGVTGERMDVKLIGAPGSNALIIVGLPGDLDAVESLIEPLDARPATNAIDARTFALENADADEIATIVQRLLTDQLETDPRFVLERIRRSRGALDLSPKVRVEADSRTNSLIVSGPQQTIALAESVISQLDAPTGSAARTVTVFTPQHAMPQTLASSVERLLELTGRSSTHHGVELIAEPASGSIIVVGDGADIDHALSLLAQRDATTLRPPAMDLQVVRLMHSDAATIATTVGTMLNDRARWPESMQAMLRAGLTVGQPSVTADARLNRLLVSAPTDLMPMATQLVAQLDQPAHDGAVDLRIFTLSRAEAGEVANALRTALNEVQNRRPGALLPSVVAEPSSNSVLVTAPSDVLDRVATMISTLDAGSTPDQAQVRTVFLEHARAESIAPIVSQLFGGEEIPFWARMDIVRMRSRGVDYEEPDNVRVAADAQLNAIVISAPPTMLGVVEEMVRQLDVNPDSDPNGRRDVHVLQVVNADAGDLSTSLGELFAESSDGTAAPSIRVDVASNTLLIRATAAQFDRIAEVVQQIDQATIATARQMQLISIDPGKANAAAVAEALERMLHRSSGNTVEVITLEELMERRKNASSGEAAPAGSQSNAFDAIPILETGPMLWTGSPWYMIAHATIAGLPDIEPEPLPPSVTIAVDPTTNSLVVVGAPRQIERVAELARQVQEQLPSEPGRVRYIALPSDVDADGLVRLINDTMRRLTPAGGRPGDLRNRVAVLADPGGSALVVTANDSDFTVVGDLIATLAQPPASESVVVRIYQLETITAERARASLDLFVAPNDGRNRRRGRQAERMRTMTMRVMSDDAQFEAVFNPQRITASADAGSNSLVVMAPAEAVRFLDQYIELIDQTPVAVQSTLKLYPLEHARANELEGILRNIFRSRFRSQRDRSRDQIEPQFQSERRTNTLLVTASPEDLSDVDHLLKQLDAPTTAERHALRLIELDSAVPSAVARMLNDAVIGESQELRNETMIVADDGSGLLLVRASDDVNGEIDDLVAQLDRDTSEDFPVRSIVLERADAESVARALQRFFDDRARIASSGQGRRTNNRKVSIIGEQMSKTLLIAADDEDYAEIERLVAQFDSPAAMDSWDFRIVPVTHAKASDLASTVRELIEELTWGSGFMMFSPRGDQRGSIAVRADERLNSLIVTGVGDKFDLVERLVSVLDAPEAAEAQRVVRFYRPDRADPQTIVDVISELYNDGGRQRRWWEDPDPTEVRAEIDDTSGMILVAATAAEQDEIAALIASVDEQMPESDATIAVLPIEYAEPRDVARTLRDFIRDRARLAGEADPKVAIRESASSSSIVVAANGETLATVRDLLTRLDRPDVSGDREIDIIALAESDPEDIAEIVREQFSQRNGQGVIVTPDLRTNSLVLNGPREVFAQAKALIAQLDQRDQADEAIIRTFPLTGAQAIDAVDVLSETLQLDSSGETRGLLLRLDENEPAVEINARITADARSNSLIVTASSESLPLIERLIRQIDDVPAVSPVEYHIVPLKHAMADDVSLTLDLVGNWGGDTASKPRFDYNRQENQLIISASADQFEQIKSVIDQIDQPSETERITEFVPLEFAEAAKVQEALAFFYGPYAVAADTPGKRNVKIVADPATNSLVISADATEWESVRTLLAELDSEEYDASLQLRVLPLLYADANSVARAVNDVFQAQVARGGSERGDRRSERNTDRNQGGGDERRDEPNVPSMLVEADEWVRVSAERLTNSLIISANRQNVAKIEQIVEQIDQPDFAQLPAPRLIPVRTGDPEQLARDLEALYLEDENRTGRQAMRIVGSSATNTIIVRAEDNDFAQILTLAEALQQEARGNGLAVHVLTLTAAPARRVADALEAAYRAKAEQLSQPLSIEVDPAGNTLVIAAAGPLYQEIEATAKQLDALAPSAGQGIFIIDLENIAPEKAKSVIESIGLHQPQNDATTRIVSEPIRVSLLPGRSALVIVGNPADRDTVVGLLKGLDAEPELATAFTRVVSLEHARASAIAGILDDVLDPGAQQSKTALAAAIREQVRRLNIRRSGVNEPDVALDLSVPIRVIADDASNTLMVSSTEDNVAAVEEVIALFDRLPVTDAVTVQLFPLNNIAADQFVRIVSELFEQGKALGTIPGAEIQAVPGGMVGRALLDEIAISTDERTNTIVVAGKEESVALVEVLAHRLDAEVTTGWVEPRVVSLEYADATELAETLEAILVDGATSLPQSNPLQQQIGRLRVARMEGNTGRVLEADVFQPMTRLIIRAEEQLNALLLVGSPPNLEVVSELVAMLDVEAASPSASVRIYPIKHASAARLQQTVTSLFEAQVRSRAIREEDRVVAQTDERTNTLIVTTSPRSFAVLEGLLDTLDAEIAPDLREIRRIELEHASATRLQSLIQDLMDARLERLRKIQPETADLERATVVADTRTNSLVVVAGNESYDVVEKLARELDGSTLDDPALIKVIALESGNAERLSDTIRAIMDRRYAELPNDLQDAQKPLVLTDPRSNSLLIAANPEDFAAIETLVRQLEATPSDPAIGVHVVSLPSASSARELAPRLQRLMRDRQQSLGDSNRPSDRVTVESDEMSNTLIVAASRENFEVVEGLVEMLVSAGADAIASRAFEIIPVTRNRASDLVDLVEELYADDARRSGATTLQVSADDRTNAVVVKGASDDIDAIRDLVGQLDGTRPAQVVEIRHIPLQSANSIETVALIENVLNGRGLNGRGRGQQATVLKYMQEIEDATGMDDASEMEVSAAIRESIVLTPDVRTNTIIVTAPAASMELIVKMVEDLDETSTGAKSIRIFKLKNADALAMSDVLTDLFNLRQGRNLFVLKPREDGGGMLPPAGGDGGAVPAAASGASGLGGADLTAVPDERQQLSITVDSRTNTLLVSGTPTYLDLVEEVVNELDALEANEREIFIYPLRNSKAEDVASVIGEFVRIEQEKLVGTLSDDQLGSAARLLEREITIQGDTQSNAVIVSASPRYIEQVRKMITQLDVDPPQVLIQVMLAEITLDAGDEFGIDLEIRGQQDNTAITAGFGLASAFVGGMGVPTLTVAGTDFDLVLRALETQGRVHVLSNPSVMAANNEPAELQVGQTIRVPDTSSFTDGGNTNTSTTEQELGVKLNVTPTINPDGYVRMSVEPEISNLTSQTTQISEELESPVINVRRASTTVTVRDGQTIVIGGLISDRFERRIRKVPFFGDIPLIGALFSSETQTSAKTELLIVLTPHVIQSPTDHMRVDEVTAREVDRLTLPESIKERIRNGEFDLGDGLFDAEGKPIDLDDVEQE